MRDLDVDAIASRLRQFADARDWEQFHDAKNLTTAIVVEAAELAEIFQWRTPEESVPEALDAEVRDRVADEVADVLIYLIRLVDRLGIDPADAVERKIAVNEARFPRPDGGPRDQAD
jgi:NTP pyrophosphatase (non-canonical NTP hydrolase)